MIFWGDVFVDGGVWIDLKVPNERRHGAVSNLNVGKSHYFPSVSVKKNRRESISIHFLYSHRGRQSDFNHLLIFSSLTATSSLPNFSLEYTVLDTVCFGIGLPVINERYTCKPV